MRRLAQLALLLGLVLLVGCERAGSSFGTSTRSASWSGNKGTPGIDDGTMAAVKLWGGPGAPVEFAVWSDLPSHTGRSSSSHGGVLVEWRLYAADGRSVEVRYEASDGKAGAVEIDGRRFDPAKGNLFLIRTDRQPFRVEQVAFDLARLPLDEAGDEPGAKKFEDRPAAIRAVAELEPRIGDFFGMRTADAPGEPAPGGNPVNREDAIDPEAIERIEDRFERGEANDSFPPYTEPPIDIETQPLERR